MSTQLTLISATAPADRPRTDEPATPATGPGTADAVRSPAPTTGSARPAHRLDRRTIESGRRGVAAARAALEAANERVRSREAARRAERDAELARAAAARRAA